MQPVVHNRSVSSLSVVFTNIRSVIPKLDALCSVLHDCSSDIVVLTETWLSPDICDNELNHCFADYNIFRCDRKAKKGGGVLIAVKKHLSATSIHMVAEIESCWVSLSHTYPDFVIGVCYRPPNYSDLFVQSLHDNLSSINRMFAKSHIVLLGDFNYPHIDWTNLSAPSSPDARAFLDLSLTFNLEQLVSAPTRSTVSTESILDLVFASHPEDVSSLSAFDGLSDHRILHFFFAIYRIYPS